MVKFAGNTIKKVMDFLTKAVLPFFRYRLKQIESHVMHADAVQQKQLSRLIDVSKQTEWGKKYDYKSIRNYEIFQERIPIQQYDDVKPYVERMLQGEQGLIWPTPVKWFAKSSGTTNDKSKYLPVSKEILWRCHYKGGFDAVALYLGNNPSSNFFGRKGLIPRRQSQAGSPEPARPLRRPFGRTAATAQPPCQPCESSPQTYHSDGRMGK